MAGLLDIAAAPASVEIRGTTVEVFGISAAGLAYLMKFPEIKAMLSGKEVSLDAEVLATKAPQALAAILACGTGQVGNLKAEAVAASLTVDEQAILLAEILALTFPRGLGPFAADIQRLAATVGGVSEDGSRALASTSQ
ncbi:MAG: hypothetical protein WAP47_08830 [Candidatus Rokuibacteriota bacterium]